jgi:hypothetical protein
MALGGFFGWVETTGMAPYANLNESLFDGPGGGCAAEGRD